MAQPASLANVSKEAVFSAYSRAKKRLDSLSKSHAESLERVLNTGAGLTGSAAAVFIDAKWGADLEIAGFSLPLLLGIGATAAGLAGVGDNYADTIAAAGTGMLSWELGKLLYHRIKTSDGQSVEGMLPAPRHHHVGYLPPPGPSAAARPAQIPYPHPSAEAFFRPAVVGLEELQRQWAQLAG